MYLLLFVVLILSLTAILVLIVTQYKVEVKPATALVANNIWTGETHCLLPGTYFIIPGIHRVLEKEVTLRNAAENPSNVHLITADGIELEVDYIVRRFQVGYPDMPNINSMTEDQKNLLKAAVIKAVTAIDYSKLRDTGLTRMVAKLQEYMEKKTLNQLFPGSDIKTGEIGTIDKELMKEIEKDTNGSLRGDLAATEWGLWLELDLEDYNLPAEIRKAREQRSSAKIAGKAINEKAVEAGVDPRWIIAGEALGNLFGKKTGGE